ncbi:hypothetical protein ACOCG7_34420 (plasmid) [Paraburkholderia sp. DD10]|uniref:hypothetical protein n=1 Tax=Paraburkholderia sp. DD10 TaxID=3409691 RepID=UPI003B9E402A
MKRKLEYTLCRTHDNAPLVTLDSSLGNGQEVTPATLRSLAAALLHIAAEAEQQDLGEYHRACRVQ